MHLLWNRLVSIILMHFPCSVVTYIKLHSTMDFRGRFAGTSIDNFFEDLTLKIIYKTANEYIYHQKSLIMDHLRF